MNIKHTADIITTYKEKIVLIDRLKDPKGYAIPGGHLESNETLEECAQRELLEETTLQAITLKQFKTYSGVNRDPRGRYITTVFTCESKGAPYAGSDAKSIKLIALDEIDKYKSQFAFDHYSILKDYQLHMNQINKNV